MADEPIVDLHFLVTGQTLPVDHGFFLFGAVSRHLYVAYPLGLKGVVVGHGDTYEAALSDVKTAAFITMLKVSVTPIIEKRELL